MRVSERTRSPQMRNEKERPPPFPFRMFCSVRVYISQCVLVCSPAMKLKPIAQQPEIDKIHPRPAPHRQCSPRVSWRRKLNLPPHPLFHLFIIIYGLLNLRMLNVYERSVWHQ